LFGFQLPKSVIAELLAAANIHIYQFCWFVDGFSCKIDRRAFAVIPIASDEQKWDDSMWPRERRETWQTDLFKASRLDRSLNLALAKLAGAID